jgi:hypothetical protein
MHDGYSSGRSKIMPQIITRMIVVKIAIIIIIIIITRMAHAWGNEQ